MFALQLLYFQYASGQFNVSNNTKKYTYLLAVKTCC